MEWPEPNDVKLALARERKVNDDVMIQVALLLNYFLFFIFYFRFQFQLEINFP